MTRIKSLFCLIPIARSSRAYALTLEHLALPKSRPDEGREARLLDLGARQGFGSAFLSRAPPPGTGALTPNRRNKS